MNSINKNGCSVSVKPKIISHTFVVRNEYRYWDAVIENNGAKFYAQIIENISYTGKKYYTGELRNNDIAKRYNNKCIIFGFSDYYDTYRYIIEAMLRVINGDYSEIKGAGFCTFHPH